MSDQKTVVAARYEAYQFEIVEERVTMEVAVATLREREQAERDLLAKTVGAGRVMYVTKNCVHHYTCSTLGNLFEIFEVAQASDREIECRLQGIAEYQQGRDVVFYDIHDVRRSIEKLTTPLDTDAMVGRRRCFVCAPTIPDPPAKPPRVPRGMRVGTLGLRDVGRTYEGAAVLAIVIAADAIVLALHGGRSLKFDPEDRIVLGART